MVVKSATKKKLMDSGWSEPAAHIMANDRRWEDVIKMSHYEVEAIMNNAGIISVFYNNKYKNIWDWWFRTPRTWEFKFNDQTKVYEFQFGFMGNDNKYVRNSNGVVTQEEMGFEGLGSLFGEKDKNDFWTWEELAVGKLNPHFDTSDINLMMKQLGGANDIVKDVVQKIYDGKYIGSHSFFIDAINRQDVLEVFKKIIRCKHGIDETKYCEKCDDEMFDGLGSLFK